MEQDHAVVLSSQGHACVALSHTDKVHWHQVLALVQQLEIRMLPIIAQTAPEHRRSGHRTSTAVNMHPFAVGLHVLLLQKPHQFAKRRVIRCHMVGAGA